MFCENCGHEVGATSKFCKKCGIKIVRDVVDDTDSKPLMVKIENNSIGTHAYTKELKEYFERVLEQETIVDELELAKQALQDCKPAKLLPSDVDANWENRLKGKSELKKEENIISTTLAIFFFGAIPGLIGCSIFWFLITSIFNINKINPFILVPTTWLVIAFLFAILGEKFTRDDNKRISSNNDTIDIQNREMEKQHDLLVEKELEKNKNQIAYWNKEYEQNEQYLVGSRKVLVEIYSVGLVYDSYRNFPATIHIKQSLESGKASTLEEAYKLFDLENKLEKIISRLDSSNRLLGQILDKMDLWGSRIVEQLNENQRAVEQFHRDVVEHMECITDKQESMLYNQNIMIDNQKVTNETLSEISKKAEVLNKNTKALSYIRNTTGKTYDIGEFIA